MNVECEKSYKSTVSDAESSNSHQVSSGKEDPERPKLSRDRDQNEVFMDGVLFPTSMEDLDDKQQLVASNSVRSETLKAKPTEPHPRELRRKSALLFSPTRDIYIGRDGRERPLSMTGLEDYLPRTPQSSRDAGSSVRARGVDSISRAGSARHPVELKAPSSMESLEREASSDAKPASSTIPIRKLVEDSEMTSAALDFNDRHLSDDGRTDITDDSDDEYEDVSEEVVAEEEADNIVRGLLEKYTTLFQSPDALTKPGHST